MELKRIVSAFWIETLLCSHSLTRSAQRPKDKEAERSEGLNTAQFVLQMSALVYSSHASD